MRRLLRLALALALPLACLPSHAGLRAAAAPARALPSLAPAPSSLTGRLSLGIAPLSIPALASLGVPAFALPAAAAAPLPLSPSRMAELVAARANDNHPAVAYSPAAATAGLAERLLADRANDDEPGAAASLGSLAAPGRAEADGGRFFDGGGLRAAADAPALRPGPGEPRLRKPSLPRRLFPKRVPTAYHAFSSGLGHAALWSGLGIAAWGVISWAHAPFVAMAAGAGAVAVLAAVDLARWGGRLLRRLRGLPRPAPVAARRPVRWAARLGGAALGVSIALAAVHYAPPAVELAHRWSDSRVELSERENVRAIGGYFGQEAASVLARNPVGRGILRSLEDRGGVLRMPHFYVITNPDVLAQYSALSDGVYIDAGQITGLGYTVDRFLTDPAVQREVVAAIQSTLAHELTHTAQARRNPLEKEYWQSAMEHEYESFVNELFYNHERLKADPAAPLQPNDAYAYESALADLAGYLRELDGYDSYKDNVHVDNARWRAWRADLFARWPAHRVEGYLLLAERAQAQGLTAQAQRYRVLAQEAAEAAGLPAPAPLGKR